MRRLTGAQAELVVQHLHLAERQVRRLRQHGADDDLQSIAYEALCTAALTFDPDRSSNFAAHAWMTIEYRVRDHRCATARRHHHEGGTLNDCVAPVPCEASEAIDSIDPVTLDAILAEARLSMLQWQAFTACAIFHGGGDALATERGVSPGTIYRQAFDARKRLRAAVKKLT